ncbi:MAG: pantoate--beta-alanine ligase [Candidatus Dormiibacterota bacterium]
MAEPAPLRPADWRSNLPRVVNSPEELRQLTAKWAAAGESVGLVPTMGSLHDGHLSLVKAAQRDCSRVVVSVFVNPLQFGAGEGYLSYPRQIDADMERLAEMEVDACFCPAVKTLYPPGFATRVVVEAGGELWEAERRPGHFIGVATVVTKLLAATGPCRAYFGEKDAQQAAVVSRLAQDLDLGVEVSICPTVRDPSGLALSSRNVLLTEPGRRSACCLSQGLIAASRQFARGITSASQLVAAAAQVIEAEPAARLDYAGVVDPLDFQSVKEAKAESRVLVAAQIDGVHLIDTALLSSPPRLSH